MGLIAKIKNFPKFLLEVKNELKKVSWSTREELFSATIVVLIGVFFLTAYIGIIDSIFSKFLHYVIR